VWRARKAQLEIALVHRPRYGDWSLPKGKLAPRESRIDAAVREVGEELGSQVAVSRWVSRIAYPVDEGRKEVDFWLMHHLDGRFEPNEEVDEIRWLAPRAARDQLSYSIEQSVVDEFTARPVPESVVILLRHARAGKRAEWHGDDNDRPLDERGRRQADRLAGFLSYFAADRIIAAHPVRCVQTVQPLAQAAGLEIAVDGTFSDDAWTRAPGETLAALHALAKPGRVTVISSQGAVIPGLVDELAHPDSSETKKGAGWVLGFVDGNVVSADYYPRAAR
jgi:8-oxo-dGTP diphosphatase